MKVPSNGYVSNSAQGERKVMNSELWHACAGPLVSLPPVGSLVVYFPQGHSEQVCFLNPVFISSWTFRHIYRGQPKRHLLTTGWSIFVSSKRLIAGDSVLFIRDDRTHLLVGIRRANRQQPALSSSVISSDSMHIGLLAAAAHAAANNSPFTIFYNPRASTSEFVIPLAKYNKEMYSQVAPGMRFRMTFETEDCGVRRYMGTVTGISDLDPVRWRNSHWHNLQVGWDESSAGERPNRISMWEIEPILTPFYICPSPFFRPNFPKQAGFPDNESDLKNVFKRGMPWLGNDFGLKDASSSAFPGMSLAQWMSMQQNPQLAATQSGVLPNSIQSNLSSNDNSKLLSFQSTALNAPGLQFGKENQASELQQPSLSWPQQQQLQQLLQSTVNSQQHQFPHQQQQHQLHQLLQSTLNSQQQVDFSQLQHRQHSENTQVQQNGSVASHSYSVTSLPQDLQFPQQIEQSSLLKKPQQLAHLPQDPLQLLQQSLIQRSQGQQLVPQNLQEQKLQLQFLQKLQQQQQHQQSLIPVSSHLEKHVTPPQQTCLENLQAQQLHLSQNQMSGNSYASSAVLHSPQLSVSQLHFQASKSGTIQAQSGPTEGDAPSCSTSPSTNNCQVFPSTFLNKIPQGRSTMQEGSAFDAAQIPTKDHRRSADFEMKYELLTSRGLEKPKYKGASTDYLDRSSSATFYSLEASGLHQSFSLPSFCLDADIQSNCKSTLSLTENVDGLTPDVFLSRGCDSGKDIQNLLSDYGSTQRDIETELSSAGINLHSLGMPEISFKENCSNDGAINDAGVQNNGLWPNQTPRLRTYTKVQKRGSVGRTIDVTRYKGYEELRHDLARMFAIEGQLEDSHRTEWKLVYVDHENDILLVGDDPWEEFVSCVQSIKILSAAEVTQMSLDGDLGGQMPPTNQESSGNSSDNIR